MNIAQPEGDAAPDLRRARSLLFVTLGAWLADGPTPQTAEALAALLSWLDESCGELSGRLGALREALALEPGERLERLQTDYASTFCVGRERFPTSESIFRTGLVMQEPRDAARRWMRRFGLERAPGARAPEDHLGELFLLAHAVLERSDAAGESVPEAFEAFLRSAFGWLAEAEPIRASLPDGTVKDLLLLARTAVEADWTGARP